MLELNESIEEVLNWLRLLWKQLRYYIVLYYRCHKNHRVVITATNAVICLHIQLFVCFVSFSFVKYL